MNNYVADNNDSFEITNRPAKTLGIDLEKENVSKIQINIDAKGFFALVVERYITYP